MVGLVNKGEVANPDKTSLHLKNGVIVQAPEGPAYAHRNRIAHRNVTADKIFLFPDKRAISGDFGISKVKIKIKNKGVSDV